MCGIMCIPSVAVTVYNVSVLRVALCRVSGASMRPLTNKLKAYIDLTFFQEGVGGGAIF